MKNYKSAFHPNMEKIPNIFRRLPVQVWYFLAAPLFFMAFLLVYCPFDSKTFLDAGRGLFYFNVSILFSILFVTLVITRLAFHFIFRGRQLETMRNRGLRLHRPDEEFTVYPVKAYSMEEYPSERNRRGAFG